jgi:hypothetical protein
MASTLAAAAYELLREFLAPTYAVTGGVRFACASAN